MKILVIPETQLVAGGDLNIQGRTIHINNDFDIPEEHFKIIEDTFQNVIDERTTLYKAAQSLKDLHICKYDTTHYFTSMLNALAKR